MDPFEEESDEDVELQHWNNWSEPVGEFSQSQTCEPTTKKCYVFNKQRTLTNVLDAREARFGNWIPPVHFRHPKGQKKLLKRNNNYCNIELSVQQKKVETITNCKWKINEDWGERVELNDVTKFNEGDFIWGVVNLGLFGRIKLWINEYNNVCALAEGTISKVGSSEASFLSIVNKELLRKMLCLSSVQWTYLCDEVLESKATLNFDAFSDYDLTNKSSLDKMWFFICKRRHFLQDQYMLVKLCGAVKCLKRFEIIPKLVVQDIRNIKGAPIP